MECSEMDRDLLRYWAKGGHVRDNCRGDDAAFVDDPGGLLDMDGHCGRWQEMVHQGSWRKSGVDKVADLDLLVHTVQTEAAR